MIYYKECLMSLQLLPNKFCLSDHNCLWNKSLLSIFWAKLCMSSNGLRLHPNKITQHEITYHLMSSMLHCKPIPVMKTGFSLWSFSHREKPFFVTGFPVMKTDFSLWGKLHKENPVPITGMSLQCSLKVCLIVIWNWEFHSEIVFIKHCMFGF